MVTCLLSTFAEDELLKSTCDFQPDKVMKGEVVYEVLKVKNGLPLFLNEHLERFQHSLLLAQIKGPSDEFIKESLRILISGNGLKQGNIRFQVSRNFDERVRWYCWVNPHEYPTQEMYENGVATGIYHAERINPEIKRYNEPLKSAVTTFLGTTGFYEALLTDQKGFIKEGSRSNLFFVRKNKLLTPPISQVLPGVTRRVIIQLALDMGIPVSEQQINHAELNQMEAAFLSGTSPGILPIFSIDELSFCIDNKIVSSLIKTYNQHCSDYLQNFEW